MASRSNGNIALGQFSTDTSEVNFKILILGDASVGKTCLLVQFKDGAFLGGNYISTIGIDFRSKVVDIDDSKVKLQIWDTGGQERFRSITRAYYRDCHAVLLVYDVTSSVTFHNVRSWLSDIRHFAPSEVLILLLGNKVDLTQSREVATADGEALAKENKILFMETSARTGLNVELAFHALARELLHRSRFDTLQETDAFNVDEFVIENQQKASSDKKCCRR